MGSVIILVVILAKFGLPLLFFNFPFQASWVNFILDTSDGDILMHYGMDPVFYQQIDKLADYVTYIFMALAGYKWKIGRTIILLFIIRTVGQILFFTTGDDLYFFFFPNFLEPLFMIYSLFLYKYGKQAYKKYQQHIVPIWFIIITYKMWNEYNIHIARNDLSEYFFGFNN